MNNIGRLRMDASNVVTEPVTLAQAKEHLRIETSFTDDDTYITMIISVARNVCENYLGFIIAKNTALNYYLDKFPSCNEIELHGVWQPGTVGITYVDSSDNTTVWNASNYSVDNISIPARLILNSGSTYPITSSNVSSGINIDLTNAGVSDSDELPKAIYHAILMMIGHLYENRQDVVVGGGKPYDMPKASEHLLNPHRVVLV